jgi:hypothetical protein
MLRLFPNSARRADASGTERSELALATVRSIESPRRLPETLIEERLAKRLKETGAISLLALVSGVAADLYGDELRKGAGVLDIGLFGSRLFSGDVMQELKAGDGILWEIKPESK